MTSELAPATSNAPWRPLLDSSGVKWGQTHLDTDRRKLVVVLGNAYGLMPYQEPLACRLAEAGFNALWSSAPGQEGAKGRFGIEDGVAFLQRLARAAQEEGWELALLCHCASILGAVEFLNRCSPVNVRCLLSYGPLLNLPILRARALGLLVESGTAFEIQEETWNLDLVKMLGQLRYPTFVAHSKDQANARRATAKQVYELSKLSCVKGSIVLEEGYDESIENLPFFCDHYIRFLGEHL